MRPVSYKRHRFPPDVIRHAVWLYFRFTLIPRLSDQNPCAHDRSPIDMMRHG